MRKRLNLSRSDSIAVELPSIHGPSIEEIDTQLLKLLKSKGDLGNTFVLIDECYYGITCYETLRYLHSYRGCWISGVLTGQNFSGFFGINDMLPADMKYKFQIQVLRRVYRGTRAITVASSTLKLTYLYDFQPYLANKFSYIEGLNDLKLESFEKMEELADFANSFVVAIWGKAPKTSFNFKLPEEINEEITLYDEEADENYVHVCKCVGAEWNTVCIILSFSPQEVDTRGEVIFQLLSVYTSRAVNSCLLFCSEEIRKLLEAKFFPKKNS